ncbi:hypothetical protein ACJDU8_04520 [Clostridium sp. WILCCON 0269]|uniref:DUF47 domain-containing protein n=1 Tax=Candidatus Clostridium eludens TaxID=3381663 RepID=A0ABW8SFU7_9CLOT
MLEEFGEFVDFFIDKRLNDISLALGKNDERYKQLQTELRKVQDKVMDEADKKLQELFIEYGDVTNEQIAIIYREIYMCAFRDALKAVGVIETMKMK